MLAAKRKVHNQFKFPLWVTPKIDGIRSLNDEGNMVSRSLKPIPNKYTRDYLRNRFKGIQTHGLDGELDLRRFSPQTYASAGTNPPTFQDVSSAFMGEDGEPDFVYRIFDIQGGSGYLHRMEHLADIHQMLSTVYPTDMHRFQFLFPVRIENQAELDAYVQKQLDAGLEGAMARVGNLPYRIPRGGGENRSTFNEGYLIKIKPLESDEAIIVGFVEEMQNTNEQFADEVGRMKRSHHQEGMVGKNTLGALICKSPTWPGVTFNLGSGISSKLADEIWANQALFLGKTVTYKYQEIGSLERPRQPVFVGIRSELDI